MRWPNDFLRLPRLGRIAALLGDQRFAFVAVNILVNLLLLARSYVTMQVLDYRELGMAALLQSILLLCGALQFGFLNGGYRLLCSAEGAEARRINNLVYTVIGALCIAFLAVALVASSVLDADDLVIVGWLGAIGGGATLLRTWMMNQMVAKVTLARLNWINLVAGAASVACLLALPLDPLAACLAAVVAQPIAFAVLGAIADRSLLPTGFEFGRSLVRATLKAGFALFVLNLLLQGNLQLERWYVTGELGLESLGKLYLAILFTTLFQMVPTSLDQVFLPPAVRAHDACDTAALKGQLRQFALVMSAYCGSTALALVFLAEPLTALLLPDYVQDLRWVYILAPGLIAFAMASPLAIAFNIVIRYRWFLVAYGFTAAVTAAIFVSAIAFGSQLDLDQVTVVRSAGFVLMAAIIAIGWIKLTRKRREFRFLAGSGSD
ncbi:lipopolysaccharide biosynthesis protein [Qipengyuania citrea]|uniref:lipopolysaccharide biosynthesis protein n=1 Tax=Qipengyuania citrea TaxID=225971 RepID=UPI00329A5881